MNNPNDLNRILHKIAAREVPSVDLRHRIRQQLRSQQRGSARRKVLGSLAASLIVLLTVFAFRELLPQLVHENIHALQPTQSATQDKPVSYHGTIAGRMVNPNYLQGKPEQLRVDTWQAQVWAQSPNLARIEVYNTCFPGPGTEGQKPFSEPAMYSGSRAVFSGPTEGRCTVPQIVTVLNEQGVATISPLGDSVNTALTIAYQDKPGLISGQAYNPMQSNSPMLEKALIPASEISLNALQAEYTQYANHAVMIGLQSIIGRPAYVIDAQYNNLVSDSATEMEKELNPVRRVFWIDQELHIPLAIEVYNTKDQSIYAWSFTSFELNPEVDEAIYKPLVRGSLPKTFKGLDTIWQRIAAQVDFPIYSPVVFSELGTNIVPMPPVYDKDRDVVVQEYLSQNDDYTVKTMLRITQGKPERIASLPLKDKNAYILKVDDKTSALIEPDSSIMGVVKNMTIKEIVALTQPVIPATPTATPALPPTVISPDGKTGYLKPEGKVLVALPVDRMFGNFDHLKLGDKISINVTFVFEDVDPNFQQLGGTLSLEGSDNLHIELSNTTPVPKSNITPMPPPRIVTQTTIKDAEVFYYGEALHGLDARTPPYVFEMTPRGGGDKSEGKTLIVAVSPDDATTLVWTVEAKVLMSFVIVK